MFGTESILMNTWQNARAIFDLVRLRTSATAALAAFVSVGMDSEFSTSVFAALVVGTICGAGFALNDLFDWRIDAINAPNRPIPSGRVTKSIVLWVAIILFSGGNFLAAFQGGHEFLVSLGVSILLILYSVGLKKYGLVGNIVTALMCCAIFFYAGAATQRPYDFFGIIAVVFPFIVAREILLDVFHYKGDAFFGRQTLAVVYSRNTALGVARVVFLLSAGIGILVGLWQMPKSAPLLVLGVTTLFSAVFLFPSDDSVELQRFVRISRFLLFGGILFWVLVGWSI